MEVKGRTGPVESFLLVNVTLNACNVVKGRLCEGRGGILKSSRIKTNSSFTLVQKRLLFFYKQACHTKGGGEDFFGGGTEVRWGGFPKLKKS